MDKYEYKVRADEIKALIAEGEYAEACNIADTIDWRRVRSVMMLCTISDLYKINRRYQESLDILLLAYEKHPTGRLIVYSLCELSIKLGDYVQAVEYYKQFARIAPKDTGRYILQYRLYEAQDISLEERIAVLEEFKKRDYREKWGYELAYLYHRIGLATKCVEECDEMFLWFGEGKYVIKALELKALHEPLNQEQQAKYDLWTSGKESAQDTEDAEDAEDTAYDGAEPGGGIADDGMEDDDAWTAPDGEEASGGEQIDNEQAILTAPTTELPEVKTVDLGQYNTINLQMALAESMKELMEEDGQTEDGQTGADDQDAAPAQDDAGEENTEDSADTEGSQDAAADETDFYDADEEDESWPAYQALQEKREEDEDAPTAEEVSGTQAEARQDAGEPEAADAGVASAQAEDEDEEDALDPTAAALVAPLLQETAKMPEPAELESFNAEQIVEQMKQEAQKAVAEGRIAGREVITPLNAKPTRYDNMLAQEYDGQISLVMPETAKIEKQITGQMSIDDIMAEWEQIKKTSEKRRMEEVRQRILAHTGNLFADFDEATKNGLLEELERAVVAAIMKDADKKPAIKQVILPDDDMEFREPDMSEDDDAAADFGEEEPEEDAAADDTADDTDEVEELEEIDEDGYEDGEDAETSGAAAGDTEEAASDAGDTAEAAGDAGGGTGAGAAPAKAQERELTPEERELFGQFIHHRRSRQQLVHTLDNMSLASCTGNVIVTGDEELTTLTLAKSLIKEMQYNDNNFSGKVAKITANVLNTKDVAETFARLDNGALIIEKASRLKDETVAKIVKFLEKDNMGLLLLMIDRKQKINRLLSEHQELQNNFNLRVDIEPLNDEALVAYARQYAEEKEYSIDEFGILALHTRIADRQTSDHEVSMAEVRELVDEAIYYANKKTPKHFMDILLAKRYDDEDMIILREKDFMHYE